MSTTKKKIKYGGYCAVLPTNERPLSDDLFDLDGSSIVYPSEEFDAVNRWDFDGVYNGPKEFLESYKASISPLVQAVEHGENSMLIFSGIPFMDPMEYLTARNGRKGFISMAADQLIKASVHGRQKLASVTFSWFKVECSSSEAITDLLRVASTPATSRGPDPNLVLREVGKGKGMFVSGLWEVELAAGSDVESVIAHVAKLVPGCAHTGTSHSIFQLTLTPSKHGGSTSTSHILPDEHGPSRLTFAVLSGLAPAPSADPQQVESPPVYPWVDQLSDLLVWMNARRPSPPFHKSRILLMLRDAICGRMPCAMYYLLQPTTPAVADNCLWLQLCFRIREIIMRRANTLPGQNSNVSTTQASPAIDPSGSESHSPSVSDAPPISSTMMYPATASPGLSNQHAQDDYTESEYNHAAYEYHEPKRDQFIQDEEDAQISFDAIRRKSGKFAQRNETNAPLSQFPGGPGEPRSRGVNQSGNSNRHQDQYHDGSDSHYGSSYNISDDEPFQYLPSPPPPGPPEFGPDVSTLNASYVNPFDEVLASRGIKPAEYAPKRGVREVSPTRRRTASDVSDMVHEALHPERKHEFEHAGGRNYADHEDNNENRVTDPSGHGMSGKSHEQHYIPETVLPATPSNSGLRSSTRDGDVARNNTGGNHSDVYLNRRDERNFTDGGAGPKQGAELLGLEPSDLEALLEALHRSREENRSLAESLAGSEDRCAKLTREYERLVAKVQEEGYFLRNKEREKLKKVMQDLKDYEVYKQVMETAMSKMQTELDLLVKENKTIKEENVALDRQVRKLKTESFKFSKIQDDLQRSVATKTATISDLQDKLVTRTRERDSAVESLSHYKLKSSKHEGEMSTKVKSKEADIRELTAKLEAMTEKFETAEMGRATIEDSSKQEIEKFRAAHLAALDKCMGYQEENDLLRASLSDIIEAQEQSLLNEE